MKKITLLALSFFIVFQGSAGHEMGLFNGRRCITNYGVPGPENMEEFVPILAVPQLVKEGRITNKDVMDDLYDLQMGLKKAPQERKNDLVNRHVVIEEAVLYTFARQTTILPSIGVDTSEMTPVSYYQRFWLIVEHCNRDPKQVAKQPVEEYLDYLYSMLMDEHKLVPTK